MWPGHQLALHQQRRYGGVLAFELMGGREAAWQSRDAMVLMSLTANLGDTKTTIVHPATTTNGRLSEQQGEEAGINQSLARLRWFLKTSSTSKRAVSANLALPTEPENPLTMDQLSPESPLRIPHQATSSIIVAAMRAPSTASC